MSLIELYYKLALFGTNTPFIILTSIFILFVVDKRVAINMLMFSMFSIFINQYLKSIWQVPMDPSLHKEGWAFPSGHTQLNIVFWGSLLWQLRSKYLAVFLLLLLPSSYFAMVDAKYHTWPDIWGGMLAGLILLSIFVLWYQYARQFIKSTSIFILVSCGIIFALLPEMPHHFFWLWFYLGCLLPVVMVVLIKKMNIDFFYSKAERLSLFIAASTIVFVINLYYVKEPVLIFMKGFSIAFAVFFLVPFLYNWIKGRMLR